MIPLYKNLVRNHHESEKTNGDHTSAPVAIRLRYFLCNLYLYKYYEKVKKKRKKKEDHRTFRKNGPRSIAVAVFSASPAVT